VDLTQVGDELYEFPSPLLFFSCAHLHLFFARFSPHEFRLGADLEGATARGHFVCMTAVFDGNERILCLL